MLFEKTPRPSNPMPRRSRTTLWAPSAPTRNCPRSCDLRPSSTSRAVTVTPSASCATSTTSCPVADRGPGLLGPSPQDRLEPRLRDEQAPTGAHLLHAGVQAADDVGQLPAGQAVHHHDGALRQELPLGLRLDRLLDAGEPEQLEGAQVEVRGAWHR